MTNINCTLQCQHQVDGKCTLENGDEASSPNEICAYFAPQKQKEPGTKN